VFTILGKSLTGELCTSEENKHSLYGLRIFKRNPGWKAKGEVGFRGGAFTSKQDQGFIAL